MALLGFVLAGIALVYGSLLWWGIRSDWAELRRAGVNGEIEHIVRSLNRSISLRMTASALVGIDAVVDSTPGVYTDVLVVALALIICLNVALDWHDRRISKMMATLRRLALQDKDKRSPLKSVK